MSNKKKVDLSTELADLLMEGEESSATKSVRPTQVLGGKPPLEHDQDPTLAISKGSEGLERPTTSESTKSIEIDHQKSLVGFDLQRGIGAREQDITKAKQRALPDQPAKLDNIPAPMKPKSSPEPSTFGVPENFRQKDESFEPSPRTLQESDRQKRLTSDVILSAEASLIQSEQLRMAQERILGLEKAVSGLRAENEELVAAGATLRHRGDDLRGQVERLQHQLREKQDVYNEELAVLKAGSSSKNEEIQRLKMKIEELESRLSGDLKKVRVRERELENRLELVKMESHAILKSKDENILDLKRKVDQLVYELENYRTKGKELNRVHEDNRERVRRTVKALRLALTMLEGEEAEAVPLKKVD